MQAPKCVELQWVIKQSTPIHITAALQYTADQVEEEGRPCGHAPAVAIGGSRRRRPPSDPDFPWYEQLAQKGTDGMLDRTAAVSH